MPRPRRACGRRRRKSRSIRSASRSAPSIFARLSSTTRGYDNNAPRNSAPPQVASWYNVYAPELLINSNWARHEFTANLRGSYTTYDTAHSLDRPNVDAKAVARVDVTSQSRIDLEGRYLLFTDSPGSPNIQTDLAHLPIAMTYGVTAGVGHRFNRFDVSLKGTFDRTTYGDSEFIDGTTDSNAGRNYNNYGTRLRTSYEVMPGATPFVEVGADTRKYDLPVDAGGVNRSSQGYNAKVGTTLAFPPRLTGEVSFGYLVRAYQDPTLEDVRGWTVDASLVWLATALTTVKLTAATSIAESTVAGVSGQFTRDLTAQVDHAFRRWLIATLKFSRGLDDYVGSPREDLRYIASSASPTIGPGSCSSRASTARNGGFPTSPATTTGPMSGWSAPGCNGDHGDVGWVERRQGVHARLRGLCARPNMARHAKCWVSQKARPSTASRACYYELRPFRYSPSSRLSSARTAGAISSRSSA